MSSFSQLFLYIPGVIIFLIGTGMVRTSMRMKQLGASFMATVDACAHVVKKDSKNRETMNYYNVTVSYYDEEKHLNQKLNVKSINEFAVGQNVRLFRRSIGQEPVIDDVKQENLFGPWTMAIGGAVLILLAFFTNEEKQVPAMICLAIVLLGAGISILLDYLRLKKLGLQEIDAEITDIYERVLSRGTKIVKGDKSTFYPIVTYELEGRRNMRRCNINSGDKRSFKVGDHMVLYFDPAKRVVLEKNAKVGFAVAAVILIVLGILVGASTVAEILRVGL